MSPSSGVLSVKHKTAFILTSDMNCYAVVIKRPERGFFHAVINKTPYVFWLNKRSTYSLVIPKSLKYPSIAFYNLADATPINFDDLVKFGFFVTLNPGAKITPEIADIILREQNRTIAGQGVPQAGKAVKLPAQQGGKAPVIRTDGTIVGDDVPGSTLTTKRDMYGPDHEYGFKTPTAKQYAALKRKLQHSIDGVRSECVIVDLEEYLKMNNNPDDQARFSDGVIQEYGKREVIIPPIDYTEALGSRMNDSSGALGYISELKRAANVEYDKIANPTKGANRYWIMVFGVVGVIAAIGVGGYLLLGGGAAPVDFSQYLADANPFAGLTEPITKALEPVANEFGSTVDRAQDTIQDLTSPATPEIKTVPIDPPPGVTPAPEPPKPDTEPGAGTDTRGQ